MLYQRSILSEIGLINCLIRAGSRKILTADHYQILFSAASLDANGPGIVDTLRCSPR